MAEDRGRMYLRVQFSNGTLSSSREQSRCIKLHLNFPWRSSFKCSVYMAVCVWPWAFLWIRHPELLEKSRDTGDPLQGAAAKRAIATAGHYPWHQPQWLLQKASGSQWQQGRRPKLKQPCRWVGATMVPRMIPLVACFQTFRKGSDTTCWDFSFNKFCFSLCSRLSNFFCMMLYVGGGDILDE